MSPALSQGERVARDGAFTSRRGPGEGSVAGQSPITNRPGVNEPWVTWFLLGG
jgi:hypothetical protein